MESEGQLLVRGSSWLNLAPDVMASFDRLTHLQSPGRGASVRDCLD